MTVVDLPSGRVRGRREGDLDVYRGIPFAAPPVGPHRFTAPHPVTAWDGELDAGAFGPIPPQADLGRGAEAGPPDDGRGWLTANVWAPTTPGPHPVLVWIYGGAYRAGHSADPTYDGAVLASASTVVVTANHRVGVEGYGQIDGAPANRGLLDQVAALAWVRDAIAAFGGDPARVTVFGESAGAGAIAALLAMPRAAGLFGRAVLQSVPGTFLSADLAADIMSTRAALLGLPATREALADVDPAELVAAADAVAATMGEHAERWGVVAHTPTPFSPVVDGDVLPTTPWRALRDGAARDVELVVGHNHDEYRLFLGLGGLLGRVDDDLAAATAGVFTPDPAAFAAAHPDADPELRMERALSDWLFRMPSLRVAEDQARGGGTAYLYELTWRAPGQGGALGACHGLDVPLVFGNLRGGFMAELLLGPDAPPAAAEISAALRAAWTAFAHGASPGWPAWDPAGRATWIVDTPPTVAPYPEETSRALWAGHEFDPLPLS